MDNKIVTLLDPKVATIMAPVSAVIAILLLIAYYYWDRSFRKKLENSGKRKDSIFYFVSRYWLLMFAIVFIIVFVISIISFF